MKCDVKESTYANEEGFYLPKSITLLCHRRFSVFIFCPIPHPLHPHRLPHFSPVIWNVIKYNLKIDRKRDMKNFSAFIEALSGISTAHTHKHTRKFLFPFPLLRFFRSKSCFEISNPAYALAETFNHFKDSLFSVRKRGMKNVWAERKFLRLRVDAYVCHRICMRGVGGEENIYR